MSAYGYTTNFSFTLIDYNTRGWHTEEYANWQKLDGLLDSLTAETIPYIVATGAVNTFVATFAPAITALTPGLVISFSANLANTGACTVNVNGLGAKNLYRNGSALASGAIPINCYVKAIYDGTRFNVTVPVDTTLVITDGSIGYAKLSTGKPTWDASGNVTITGTASVAGNFSCNGLYEGTGGSSKRAFVQVDAATYPSNKVTFSTANPSGGSSGDVWYKYTP